MSLLSTLNSIYSINKAFTQKFHDEVKRNLDDYEAVNTDKTTKKNSGVRRQP